MAHRTAVRRPIPKWLSGYVCWGWILAACGGATGGARSGGVRELLRAVWLAPLAGARYRQRHDRDRWDPPEVGGRSAFAACLCAHGDRRTFPTTRRSAWKRPGSNDVRLPDSATLSPEGRALLPLLETTDRATLEQLLDQIPALRATVDAVSPIAAAAMIRLHRSRLDTTTTTG